MAKEKEIRTYGIFLVRSATPILMRSSVNLLESWKQQLAERAKKNEWNKPIDFVDDEGTIAFSMIPQSISGVVMGLIDPSGKVG